MSTATRKSLAEDYTAKQTAIKALTDKGVDNLTATEADQLTVLFDERDALKAEIEKFPKADAVKARLDEGTSFLKTGVHPIGHPSARQTPEETEAVKARVDNGESEDEKYLRKGPFKSLGHLAHAVRKCGRPEAGLYDTGTLGEWNGRVNKISDAIKAMPDAVKAVTGMSELVDMDGAAFVPVDIAKSIWERSFQEDDNLLALVDSTPVQGNSLKQYAWNDKSRSGGTLYGGARAYWGNEGSQGTNVKPATRELDWRLKKITVLMPVTEELMEDTLALDARLNKVAASCFAFETNKAITRGPGGGEPLGLLAPGLACRLTVDAVSGQGSNTIIGKNITSMFARRPSGSTQKLVWLYNQDIEPQLDQLNFTAGSTAAQWLFTTSLKDNTTFMLKGRRMISCEQCSALGTEGDLILWDPSSYGVIIKSSGIQQAVSMHLRFDYGEAVYRWHFRMDGRPYWDDVATPANGATRSPVITLNSSRS